MWPSSIPTSCILIEFCIGIGVTSTQIKLLIWKTYLSIIHEFYNDYTLVKTRLNYDSTSLNLMSSHYIMEEFLLYVDTPPTKLLSGCPGLYLTLVPPSISPLALTISRAHKLLNRLTPLHPRQRVSK